MRILLYLAIAFIVWRIVRTYLGARSSAKPTVGGRPTSEGRIDPSPRVDIDYSRVQDASYRDVRGRDRDADRRDDERREADRRDAERGGDRSGGRRDEGDPRF